MNVAVAILDAPCQQCFTIKWRGILVLCFNGSVHMAIKPPQHPSQIDHRSKEGIRIPG